MSNPLNKMVANLEEIQPCKPSTWEEVPLILFTLLGQLAVGGYWIMSLLFPPLWTFTKRFTPSLMLIPFLVVGLSLGSALAASFAHLGTKRNAWLALTHLSHSWLSREILFAGLFGLGWLVSTGEILIFGKITIETLGITSALGLGLVYSMAQVYRLRSAPGWDSWRTNRGFLVTAALMGFAVMAPLFSHQSQRAGVQIPSALSLLPILLLLPAQLIHALKQKSSSVVRLGLILLSMVMTVAGMFHYTTGLGILLLLLVTVEELLGRWLFYRSRLRT